MARKATLPNGWKGFTHIYSSAVTAIYYNLAEQRTAVRFQKNPKVYVYFTREYTKQLVDDIKATSSIGRLVNRIKRDYILIATYDSFDDFLKCAGEEHQDNSIERTIYTDFLSPI